MLTLNADSVCDVCAEEYGPFNLPRCIPCGHVLCASCALTIIEKTSPRLQPACPFCREHFLADGVRVIRIDFSGSSGGGNANAAGAAGMGLGAPDGALGAKDTCIDGGAMGYMDDETVLYDVRQSRSPGSSAHTSRDPSRATSRERPSHVSNGIFTTINEDHPTLPPSFDANAHKDRARELEKKIAKVATKRCSAEEVQALHREIADWMSVEKVMGSSGMSSDKEQHAALYLSNLLLRAILMNHLAHSEASRVAKGAEAQLRSRIADGELVREKLDADLRKTKNILQTRSQEVTVLKSELSRLRGEEYTERSLSAAGERMAGAVTPTRRQSLSAPTSPDSYFPSFAFSSASTAVPPASSRSNPASGANSPCSSGRTTPTALGGAQLMPMGSAFPTMGMAMGQMNGTGISGASSSASAAARTMNMQSPPRAQSTAPGAQKSTPTRPQSTVPGRVLASPTPAPAPQKYHVRSASMIHRSQTATPGLSSSSATATTASASSAASASPRRSMTPAPTHQRSASVAPGTSASASAARTLTRSMTPNLGGSTRSSAGTQSQSGMMMKDGSSTGNGSSAGGVNGVVSGGVPPVPSLPAHSTASSMLSSTTTGGLSRPPVPPKPRTLTQTSPPRGGSGRGVVDDRDGYLTEKEVGGGGVRKEKEREKKRHERWLPSALVDRMSRPATSLG